MIKISTLYKKDPKNLALVINEVNPGNEWVLNGEGVATRKFDGAACAIIKGELYKRYDVKKGRQVPAGAIPCQEPDLITGHWPHWVKVDENNKEDKYFIEAKDNLISGIVNGKPFVTWKEDGTYELCGPKVQGNPERLDKHYLVKHGNEIRQIRGRSFESMKEYLTYADIEGIVFHHPDGRMCKIRKSDFGIKRGVAVLMHPFSE
jgi:hypothetical protein